MECFKGYGFLDADGRGFLRQARQTEWRVKGGQVTRISRIFNRGGC